MRESEITPELIEFSKKAKELGFPQDVENGDWVVMDNGLPELVGTYYIAQQKKALSDRLCLILSFSRCLEWLRGKEWELRTLRESTYRQKGFER